MPNLTMLIQKMKFITLTLKQNWSIRVYGILLNEIDILLHIKKDTYQGFTNIGGHGFWDKGGVYTMGVSEKNFAAAIHGCEFLGIFSPWGEWVCTGV